MTRIQRFFMSIVRFFLGAYNLHCGSLEGIYKFGFVNCEAIMWEAENDHMNDVILPYVDMCLIT